ncbi:MAG: hypothetical protein U9O50_04135 [Acidobacteriota bacterium]|nr:hypothetical protein [Acidobacteriota bacterium]
MASSGGIPLKQEATGGGFNCGAKMLPRPYTYYYVIPVNKCLSCQKIWFDTDEMEILQFLIEEKLKSPSTPSIDSLDD